MPDFFKTFLDRFKPKPSNPTKDLTMRQVFSVSKPKRFPSWRQWKQLSSVLSAGERKMIRIASLLLILSLGTLAGITLLKHRVEIPAKGGEYTEALVGEPQLINPLYATTNDADQDLVALIYSGLLKWDPKEGLIPDLAQSIEINEEKTVYTFVIKEDAVFHNGDLVRARDIIFTISAIQNPAYRSPLLPEFRSISMVQEDDRKISFILEKPQLSFLSLLTVGILPSSAWADILPQNAPLAALNLQPIGSGPYQFEKFAKDKKGAIRSYTLKAFNQYLHGRPYIEQLTFKFYPDPRSAIDALENKFVEGVSVVPTAFKEEAEQNRTVILYSPLLSREVVLYFNQKTNEMLQKKEVREAMAYAIDKKALLDETILPEQILVGPILPGSIGFHPGLVDREPNEEKAKTLLTQAGVVKKETSDASEATKQPNRFTLTTIDSEEFVRVAQTIEQQLEGIGLDIELVRVPAESLFSQIIKPRNFELLLTTLMYRSDAEPFVFWHSSQKDGIGLNIIDYQNKEVDALLETGRSAKNVEERQTAYQTFQEKLLADIPAVFLYQSTYGHAIAKKVRLPQPLQIRMPSDRFAGIETWYIKTKKAFK